MAVYTAPSTSFIDTFIDGAQKLDDRTQKRYDSFMGGMSNAVKGGMDAWKWQQRKNAADELEQMQAELAQLQAQRDQLAGVSGSSTPNLDAFLGGINPSFNTGRI